MSDGLTCPICMDDLVVTTNFTKTECGHCFHTSCLMTNVTHNGFGCPYCREKMAKEAEDEDEDESEYDDVSVITYENSSSEYELYGDDSLTSFRMFTQRNENEEVEEETQDEDEEDTENEERERSTNLFVEKIIKVLQGAQVTYDDLVKILLVNNEEFDMEFGDDSINTKESHVEHLIQTNVFKHHNSHENEINVTIEPMSDKLKNIFKQNPMPDFDSFSQEDFKMISREYHIKYNRNKNNFVDLLKTIWNTHNTY